MEANTLDESPCLNTQFKLLSNYYAIIYILPDKLLKTAKRRPTINQDQK